MKTVLLSALALTLVLSFQPTIAKGKIWTVEARQAQLMKDINEGQKGAQLTKKEADRLRSDLADISRKKKKFRNKTNTTVLTAEQKSELEGDLNTISVNIKKLKLEKRVAD